MMGFARVLEHFLLSPLTLALLVAVMLAVAWRWLPRTIRYAGIFLEVALLALMTPLCANLLVHAIEEHVSPAISCRRPLPTTIVLLSGGVDRPARSVTDYSALTLTSIRRLMGAIILWRTQPSSELVIAGGDVHGVAESAVLASLAEQMGVPAKAIRAERHSLTTWQNATYLAHETPRLPSHIWLVSSALHLPRALTAFRAAGFRACPWSSGSLYIPYHGGGFGYFLPQSSSLVKAEMAIHEWVGGWVYSWRARGFWVEHAPSSSR